MKQLLGCILLGVACLLQPLQATQFIPLPIEKLVEKSQVIVRGTVLSKTTLRDDAGRIYTKIELQVDEVWKGSVTGNRFTIAQGGGVLGDRRVAVEGQAEYKIGEEVIAFLVLNQRGEGVTLGLSQGKFEIWKDQATGEKYARNLFHGSAPPNGRAQVQQADAGNASLKVTDLKQRVVDASK